jgi:hypothetical protein
LVEATPSEREPPERKSFESNCKKNGCQKCLSESITTFETKEKLKTYLHKAGIVASLLAAAFSRSLVSVAILSILVAFDQMRNSKKSHSKAAE